MTAVEPAAKMSKNEPEPAATATPNIQNDPTAAAVPETDKRSSKKRPWSSINRGSLRKLTSFRRRRRRLSDVKENELSTVYGTLHSHDSNFEVNLKAYEENPADCMKAANLIACVIGDHPDITDDETRRQLKNACMCGDGAVLSFLKAFANGDTYVKNMFFGDSARVKHVDEQEPEPTLAGALATLEEAYEFASWTNTEMTSGPSNEFLATLIACNSVRNDALNILDKVETSEAKTKLHKGLTFAAKHTSVKDFLSVLFDYDKRASDLLSVAIDAGVEFNQTN